MTRAPLVLFLAGLGLSCIPGVYRLKVRALGDPRATAEFTLTVR